MRIEDEKGGKAATDPRAIFTFTTSQRRRRRRRPPPYSLPSSSLFSQERPKETQRKGKKWIVFVCVCVCGFWIGLLLRIFGWVIFSVTFFVYFFVYFVGWRPLPPPPKKNCMFVYILFTAGPFLVRHRRRQKEIFFLICPKSSSSTSSRCRLSTKGERATSKFNFFLLIWGGGEE